MPNEIERLTVAIEANIDPLLKGAREGVAEVEDELKDFERTGKRAFDEAGKSASKFSQNMKIVLGAATALIAVFAVQAANRIVGFFTKIGAATVQANAQFEVFRTQFETLLGSSAAAKQRLDELAKFGVETPFELPEVVQASRLLEVFGGAALSTGENLRMIGDIAAGVNQPFADVAMWIGRMYDAMKGGRPFGEAAMRLQEMGALSGVARAELEKLQKEGASGEELWAKFNELVGSKFEGNMARLAQTFQGVTSNLIDFRDNLIRIGGERFFESIKDDAQSLLDVLDDPEMRDSLERMARAFGQAATQAKELISSGLFDKLTPEFVDKLAGVAENLAQVSLALQQIQLPDLAVDLGVEEGSTLDRLLSFGPAGLLVQAFENVPDLTESIMQIDTLIKAEDARFKAQLKGLDGQAAYNAVILEGNKKLEEYKRQSQDITEIIEEGTTATERARDAEAARLQGLADLYAEQEKGVEVEEGINEQLEKGKELLEKLAFEFIDLTEERNEKLEELEQQHTLDVLSLENDYIDKRLELGHKLAEALADLDEETAKKRSDILDKTREDLADLEADTDRDLDEQREEFQKDQLRKTEDHLREMRDIRNRYLMDIEDAVKNRDAGALRDAKRRYEEEKRKAEEQAQVEQERDQGDQDERLRQIQENEDRRAEEILRQQEKALAQVEEQEREKRQKLQEGFEQELVDLDEDHAKRLTKEAQQFAERQQQLDEMLNKRLETVAAELAKEKEINEEGAQAILEALDKVFGVGGDIDELMEDFAKRRRQQLIVEVQLKTNLGEGGGGGGGISGDTGANPQQVPTFQHGGTLLATRPTLAQFGEVPEMVTFTPLSRMGQGRPQQLEVDLKLSGSAPPGIRSADRDAIAGVLANALREAGVMIKPGGR